MWPQLSTMAFSLSNPARQMLHWFSWSWCRNDSRLGIPAREAAIANRWPSRCACRCLSLRLSSSLSPMCISASSGTTVNRQAMAIPWEFSFSAKTAMVGWRQANLSLQSAKEQSVQQKYWPQVAGQAGQRSAQAQGSRVREPSRSTWLWQQSSYTRKNPAQQTRMRLTQTCRQTHFTGKRSPHSRIIQSHILSPSCSQIHHPVLHSSCMLWPPQELILRCEHDHYGMPRVRGGWSGQFLKRTRPLRSPFSHPQKPTMRLRLLGLSLPWQQMACSPSYCLTSSKRSSLRVPSIVKFPTSSEPMQQMVLLTSKSKSAQSKTTLYHLCMYSYELLHSRCAFIQLLHTEHSEPTPPLFNQGGIVTYLMGLLIGREGSQMCDVLDRRIIEGMDSYCKKFVEDIFLRHDKDRSNVLERKELKTWVREELKSHKFFNKKMVQREFEDFFAKADTNNDGKIDRWELYDYCLKNISPE